MYSTSTAFGQVFSFHHLWDRVFNACFYFLFALVIHFLIIFNIEIGLICKLFHIRLAKTLTSISNAVEITIYIKYREVLFILL